MVILIVFESMLNLFRKIGIEFFLWMSDVVFLSDGWFLLLRDLSIIVARSFYFFVALMWFSYCVSSVFLFGVIFLFLELRNLLFVCMVVLILVSGYFFDEIMFFNFFVSFRTTIRFRNYSISFIRMLNFLFLMRSMCKFVIFVFG